MANRHDTLFEPYELKGLHIKNRFMRSPMVLSMAAHDGTVTDDLLRVYRTAAEGGVGLCCTGCMAVNAAARMTEQQLGVWTDDQIPGLATLTDTVHAYGDGCVFFAQIFSEGAHSWGYSYGQSDAGLDVNSLDQAQIWAMVEAFADAGLRVREAGFDGVHLHAGHGYLISQFLSPAVNDRDDGWGGDIRRRSRFLVEILRAIRERVGADYPVGVKMNTADYLPGGHWQSDTVQVARLLADEGVGLIEMSGGMGHMIELREALRRRVGEKEYYFWDAIGPYTDALAGTGVALAAVGGIRSPAVMEELRSLGIDLVSMARPWLCEPDLARRIQAGDRRPSRCVSSTRLCNLCLVKLGKGSVQCERFYPGDCRMSCPIGQDNPEYLTQLASGDLGEAAGIVQRDNPLAHSLSRVCHAPCETICRGRDGTPLGLKALKRFVADWARENQRPKPATPPLRDRGRVAVIGAGPAGLSCSYFLARRRYGVTVFERETTPGGMLALGIPEFRLPPEAVAADVDYVRSVAVEIVTCCAIDGLEGARELLADGYQAVFLATGATPRRRLDCLTRELPGVVLGMDLLKDVRAGGRPNVGTTALVIGGGNVAVDSAMTLLRLGAQNVGIACLEQGESLPAYPEQIEDALEEGVIFHEGWGPSAILGDHHVSGVKFARCRTTHDPAGRFHPTYCEEESMFLPADTVVLAIGQVAPWADNAETCVPSAAHRALVRNGLVKAVAERVFVGGDALRVGSVLESAAAGRAAAAAIDAALSPVFADNAAARDEMVYEPFVTMRRAEAFRPVRCRASAESSGGARGARLAPADRRHSFAEIVATITAAQARLEAEKCLKNDRHLEAESAARLTQMGPSAFCLSPGPGAR
jgi:2,4-dienoyl-CoA reductase-like NADH-dependent reductase (Old Yellow Enzyme family)/NADPH-dependent glutamate synthase beta subunit-like oxidoreductase